MEQSSIYRKSSVDRISSPEELNDYLRVTNPTVWIVLAAVVLLLVGMLVWGSFAYIGSVANGLAAVDHGVMLVRFEDETLAGNVEAGMDVTVGDTSAVISSVGYDENGAVFALADTTLADGTYEASVRYKTTQVLKLLFN